ncbi:sulfite exporter TauE/SafE family protein [Larsenimonas suaedae]|uniref:Probable membrane transporter protein n=1 Tax=Larsenimonas suaedae TaxID=1851019 RepID=A0ABU1GYC7_9GAMM|nr:sulfite exporter TauE/SafE family protein [Larsenimonas suaedae]MCM2972761.1 sulfite exporter TauE/SafE family protein [Larsenimonas suaedae]MDR5896860.1 sulfite exporter TauE/SafE family protein [Larsenimonas suaedae]
MELTDLLLYILAGAGVGFAVGLSGIGGGSLMTPLLLLFGFPPSVAVGTDLLYAALTKFSGAFSHHKQQHIDWRVVKLLAATSIPAALVTVWVLDQFFDGSHAYGDLITGMLGVMLIMTAVILIFKGPLQRFAAKKDGWIQRYTPQLTLFSGLVLGVCVTLSSVGAGVFGTAILMVLYPSFRAGKIVGTDIAHAVPLTLVAGTGHLFLGNVDFMLLGALLIGSLPAIHLGARMTRYLPDALLRTLLTGLLLVLGVRYAFF